MNMEPDKKYFRSSRKKDRRYDEIDVEASLKIRTKKNPESFFKHKLLNMSQLKMRFGMSSTCDK